MSINLDSFIFHSDYLSLGVVKTIEQTLTSPGSLTASQKALVYGTWTDTYAGTIGAEQFFRQVGTTITYRDFIEINSTPNVRVSMTLESDSNNRMRPILVAVNLTAGSISFTPIQVQSWIYAYHLGGF